MRTSEQPPTPTRLDLDTLSAVLRARPPTPAALAELLGTTVDEATRRLAPATRLGFVDHRDGRLYYRHPEAAIRDANAAALAHHSSVLETMVADSKRLVGALPELLRAWSQGDDSANHLPTEVHHGPRASIDLWRAHVNRATPMRIDLAMPNIAPLAAASPEAQRAAWTGQSITIERVRALISVRDAKDAASRPVLEAALQRGIELRMHPELPGTFWISDDRSIAVPLTWDEPWPTAMMWAESAPLAATMGRYFTHLWDGATPLTEPRTRSRHRSWDPLLELMAQGRSLEQSSDLLGFTARTGRRRLAEAMDHYGVHTQFALGTAWGKDRARHEPTT